MKKNNTWIWIVIVIIAVGVLLFYVNKKNTPNTVIEITDPQIEKVSESVQDTNETTGVGAVSISYTNALVKYADRRIQLDEACQAHPNTVTYKDNTGIMIDNRSPNALKVKIGTTFNIKPWGFKIVVLPNIYLESKTLLVDCNESQNVATILVQE